MPEVHFKLLRFLQLNHPLTEAILFGFFFILSEARKITRYCLQLHKFCGKPSIRKPRQNIKHAKQWVLWWQNQKKCSSLITVLHCYAQFLYHFRNFLELDKDSEMKDIPAHMKMRHKILLKMLIYKLLILPWNIMKQNQNSKLLLPLPQEQEQAQAHLWAFFVSF